MCKKYYKTEEHECICQHEWIEDGCLVWLQKMNHKIHIVERKKVDKEEIERKEQEILQAEINRRVIVCRKETRI
jgi:hypothetical protein